MELSGSLSSMSSSDVLTSPDQRIVTLRLSWLRPWLCTLPKLKTSLDIHDQYQHISVADLFVCLFGTWLCSHRNGPEGTLLFYMVCGSSCLSSLFCVPLLLRIIVSLPRRPIISSYRQACHSSRDLTWVDTQGLLSSTESRLLPAARKSGRNLDPQAMRPN